jgi:ADP-ribose pyrophosphatase YjhB (NUDIX family)
MCWTPHATVATVVERDGRFLIVEELSGGAVVLNQPAGHIEEHERFETAALRETMEETCWQVRLKHLIGLYAYRSDNNDITYHRLCYAAEAIEHHPDAALDDGIIQALWLTRDELVARREQLRSPMVLKCIDDYLAGKAFPLDFVYEHLD